MRFSGRAWSKKKMRYREKSEIRDGMRIDWDMPIKMDDGVVLRADIYRPVAEGKYPVIMTYGPYGKWLHFEDLYGHQWRLMCENHPDVPAGSTNKYQCWEVVDPEKWVPDGYVCIRVDSRGAGRSPGLLDIWSLREAEALAACVEWAGVQPWSNGKVGLNGISYYAENQWQTAALQPKHLAAICTWEGAADFYRDMAHHGGIFCNGFTHDWSTSQVYTVQNGRGSRGFKSRMTGGWVSGPETLSEEEIVGELGRAGPASPWEFRGVCARREQEQVARGSRAGTLERILHRLRCRSAEAVLRSFSERGKYRMGQAAQGAAANQASRRKVHRAS